MNLATFLPWHKKVMNRAFNKREKCNNSGNALPPTLSASPTHSSVPGCCKPAVSVPHLKGYEWNNNLIINKLLVQFQRRKDLRIFS